MLTCSGQGRCSLAAPRGGLTERVLVATAASYVVSPAALGAVGLATAWPTASARARDRSADSAARSGACPGGLPLANCLASRSSVWPGSVVSAVRRWKRWLLRGPRRGRRGAWRRRTCSWPRSCRGPSGPGRRSAPPRRARSSRRSARPPRRALRGGSGSRGRACPGRPCPGRRRAARPSPAGAATAAAPTRAWSR